MTSEEIYLKEHPNVTLNEYINYIKEKEREKIETENERQKNYKEWLESKVGKYFVIDFNGKARMVFQLAKDNKNREGYICHNCFEFYKDEKVIKMDIEVKRSVNLYWLNNPYEKQVLNYDNSLKIKELDENTYNKYKVKFEQVKQLQNECCEILDTMFNKT